MGNLTNGHWSTLIYLHSPLCDDNFRENESDEKSLEVGETGEKGKKPECVMWSLFIY